MRAAAAADAPPVAPAPPAVPAAPSASAFDPVRVEALVRALAGPSYAGRGRPDDRERVAVALDELLLEAASNQRRFAGTTRLAPLPGHAGFVVPVAAEGGIPAGRNVVAWIPGTTPGECVWLVAAYDGRPPAGTTVFPGADAKASGCVAVLEVAAALADGPAPARGVVVALVDLSDHGGAGAKALLAAPPTAAGTPVAVVVVERLGRSLGDALPGTLFLLGADRSDATDTAARTLGAPDGTTLRRLPLDFHAEPASDAVPFEEAGLPTVLVTAGASDDDGTPADTPDRVDPARVAAGARVVAALVGALAATTEPLTPRARGPLCLDDVRTLAAIAADVAARKDALGGDERRATLLRALTALADEVIARGAVTAGERTALRLLALQVFAGLQGRDR